LWLRTLCFAVNTKTIHTYGSTVYGVVELEESRFTRALWQKKQENSKLTVLSSCGYHVCWTPIIGEQLVCGREEGNPRDRHAVTVKKIGNIVGHVPHNISMLCSLFIRQGGTMLCVVSGQH